MVDAACTREIDAFMANVLKTYNKPQITHSDAYVQRELVNAYGDMVAQCGRLLMKAGAALDAAAKKIALQSTVFTPDARRALITAEAKGRCSKIEGRFRNRLVVKKFGTRVISPDLWRQTRRQRCTLPRAIYPRGMARL